MEVAILNEQGKIPVPETLYGMMREIVEVCWRAMGRQGVPEVSILLCDNHQIQKLNRDYRGIDEPTDVLSFPQEEIGAGEEVLLNMPAFPDEPVLLGDVVISLEKAKEQAEAYGHSFEREVGYLLTHGLLHLLGMDHISEEERFRMREKEEEVLAELQLMR
ncbi:MAG: rRNA maturation RNase YbeY [Firmicutes bacterium]|nr:rRNA maturation RNase YbeY [Bacillota bacterium]